MTIRPQTTPSPKKHAVVQPVLLDDVVAEQIEIVLGQQLAGEEPRPHEVLALALAARRSRSRIPQPPQEPAAEQPRPACVDASGRCRRAYRSGR